MKILAVSAFYHDSSACLIIDGKIIAACQEERLTRIKNDSGFPAKSIEFCLKHAGLNATDIDHLIFYEKPFLKFERLLETYLAFVPKGFLSFQKSLPLWLKEKLFQKKLLADEFKLIGFNNEQCKKILFSTHHLSHAASAFYPSPFNDAIVLTMDGVGEWDTTTVYIGKNNSLTKVKEILFPHSLGLLYSAFTQYCGFKVNSGEYKLMGLAPYGQPLYTEVILNNLIDVKPDGSFKLNMNYFDYCVGLKMINKKFDALFNFNYRAPETELKQVHMDIASSIQNVIETIILKICTSIANEYKIENLCLAGGVALNCVANGKIYESGLFKNIWVQPAAGDAGGSLGAALAAYYLELNQPRVVEKPDSMHGAYLGPVYTEIEIENLLVLKNAKYIKLPNENLNDFVTDQIINEKVIGWFQGQLEFGPRSLGNRSILADARSAQMQKKLNLKIKFRESFRPFAPAVLQEKTSEWFNYEHASPYMLMVANVINEKLLFETKNKKELFGIDLLNETRSVVPAITHVDNSARLQTVSQLTNPKFYSLLKAFEAKTQTPLLINTSFNIRSEPIVCSPEDAYRCFMGTDMDVLVLENFVLLKDDQPVASKKSYSELFALD